MICGSCGSSSHGLTAKARGAQRGRRKLLPNATQYDLVAELYDGYPGNYLDDVVFYAEEVRAAASPALEIGVGTGRLAFCLAAIGVDVVGIDSSAGMLRALERKRREVGDLPGLVETVHADMRRFELGRRFPLAIVAFRTFLYLLTKSDQRRALRAIRRHLEPRGRLIVSFFVPPRELIEKRRTQRQEMARFASPDGKGEVVALDWAEFRPRGQRVVSHITYEWRDENDRTTRRLERELVARYAYPAEMPPLLEECGYRIVAVYGGFDRRPLTPTSSEQVWVAERAR
ncbi:MAG: trans-aconitate 2-methyltransferase [Armatimonadota bacterium]